MRILHIIDTFWLGGAQTLLKSIFENQQHNNDIHVFALRQTQPQIIIDHPNVKCFGSEKKISLKRIRALKKYIKENNFDILHCHLPHAQGMGYLMKKFFFKKIKLIFHEHAEIFNKSWTISFVLKQSKKKVNKYLACSKSSKVELIEKIRIDPFRIILLNNFVDLKKYNKNNFNYNIDEERRKIGLCQNDFVVGFAGRLVDRKGWKELVDAAEMLKSNTDIKFLIAGIGPKQSELENAIKKFGLDSKMFCLGYFENMPLFYSIINCLAIPSYWEGMPIVQLEAAAMEIPVVCSDAPGLNEIFEKHNDMLFSEIGNAKELKDNIEMLYKDKPKADELANKSLQKVKRLNIEKYLGELNNIYKIVYKD